MVIGGSGATVVARKPAGNRNKPADWIAHALINPIAYMHRKRVWEMCTSDRAYGIRTGRLQHHPARAHTVQTDHAVCQEIVKEISLLHWLKSERVGLEPWGSFYVAHSDGDVANANDHDLLSS